MKQFFQIRVIIFLAVVFVASCFGRIQPTGKTVTIKKDFRNFNRIKIGNSFRADIQQASRYKVELEVDESVRPHLNIEQRGSKLKIYLDPGSYAGNITLTARITLPQLRGLGLSGATQAKIKGFDSDEPFDLQLSGASQLAGEIRCSDVDMNLSGSSIIELAGQGEILDLDASSASHIKLADFQIQGAEIGLSGASQADLFVNGDLDIRMSGSSRIHYHGAAQIKHITSSGASTISRID